MLAKQLYHNTVKKAGKVLLAEAGFPLFSFDVLMEKIIQWKPQFDS
ncbi:MAG: hypothetical protein MK289_16875 [Trichodesmium sp. ALOHA_ZT_67]|nr:hypothetical protein [Trichodesmium sp. ALOHA_ZT_67]MDT9338054.1 hypothetical protein [Trichodesmium erythraeum 21-75]